MSINATSINATSVTSAFPHENLALGGAGPGDPGSGPQGQEALRPGWDSR
jgi:hypothetical protein